MFKYRPTNPRFVAIVAAGCAGLALASAAGAVDLRDWGRKLPDSDRFVVLSQFNNQAVLDKETQLVWQRSPRTYKLAWSNAFTGCIATTIDGRSGWRLPTVEELMSLQTRLVTGVHALPTGHPFQDVQHSWTYWSATTHPGNPSYAFGVNVTTAGAAIVNLNAFAKSAETFFWCVRGGQGTDGQ